VENAQINQVTVGKVSFIVLERFLFASYTFLPEIAQILFIMPEHIVQYPQLLFSN